MSDSDLKKLAIDKSGAREKPQKKRKKLFMALGAAIIIILLILTATGFFRVSAKVDGASVVKVYPSQTFTLLNASGYVVPQRKAAVASKITGRLVALFVEEGSRVKKGQIVARLENDDLQAQKNRAGANVEVARANAETARAELYDAGESFRREKNLLAREFTTKASFDAAEARFRKAQAAVAAADSALKASSAGLREAEVGLEYSLIRAPFDSVVLTKNADIGDIVTPIGAAANAKAAVVTIADMDSLQVEADVSESNIRLIKVGQPVEIQLDALPDTRLKGEIHMVVPTADRTKASVMVKVRFLDRDGRVLPEMSAKVAFLSRPVSKDDERPRTAVNPKALTERNGTKKAFVIRENRAYETTVVTGSVLGDFIEITEGLTTGERVVLNPPRTLKSGSPVKLIEK